MHISASRRGEAILCALLIFLGALILLPLSNAHEMIAQDSESQRAIKGPFKIDDNYEFQKIASQEGWSGDGTFLRPYVIENYKIDGAGSHWGIYIGNVTYYFVIRNCKIYNVERATGVVTYHWGEGINLFNDTHGRVYSNTLENNYVGIRIAESPYTSVTNNLCRNNTRGMVVTSDGVRVSSNIFENNENEGVMIEASHVRVENNTFQNDALVLYMGFFTKYTEVHNNTFTGGGIVMSEDMDVYTTQNISADNTLNGKPIYYYKNVDMGEATLPSDAGQIILGNVKNVVVDGGSFLDVFRGVAVAYSSQIQIRNTEFSSNEDGAGTYIYQSQNVRIYQNNFREGDTGVYLRYSDYVYIYQNTFENCQRGVEFSESHYDKITENTYRDCSYGMHGFLNTSLLQSNTFYNNTYAIYVYELHDSEIVDNEIFNSSRSGITVDNSGNGVSLKENRIYGSEDGIKIYGGNHMDIRDNSIANTTHYGLLMEYLQNATIYGNKIENCTEYGIYIIHGERNRIYNNYLYYNHGSGDSYDSSHIQAYDGSSHNYWNSSSLGNYWQDWARHGDSDGDGIVDSPYIIEGTSGAKDYYPIASSVIPELSSLIIVAMITLAAILVWKKREK